MHLELSEAKRKITLERSAAERPYNSYNKDYVASHAQIFHRERVNVVNLTAGHITLQVNVTSQIK